MGSHIISITIHPTLRHSSNMLGAFSSCSQIRPLGHPIAVLTDMDDMQDYMDYDQLRMSYPEGFNHAPRDHTSTHFPRHDRVHTWLQPLPSLLDIELPVDDY